MKVVKCKSRLAHFEIPVHYRNGVEEGLMVTIEAISDLNHPIYHKASLKGCNGMSIQVSFQAMLLLIYFKILQLLFLHNADLILGFFFAVFLDQDLEWKFVNSD